MAGHDAPMDNVRGGSLPKNRFLSALIAVSVVAAAAATTSAWLDGTVAADLLLAAGALIAFMVVGTIIEVRRPGQIIGRLCLAIGTLLLACVVSRMVAVAIDSAPGRLPPFGAALAVVSSSIFAVVFVLSGPLLISRFPNGRDRGWMATLVDVAMAVAGVAMLAFAFRPRFLDMGWVEGVENPLGIPAISILGDDVSNLAFVAYGALMTAASVGLVRRYLRGDAVVRAQIRWFAAAIGTSLALFALVFLTSDQPAGDLVWGAWILSLLLPPIAIGAAITRYRLYDIDRILSNAIAYALVSFVLVSTFYLANLLLVSWLSPLVEFEGLAVAGSTLLVASLFAPVRSRAQASVDRRFHRAHYDAERMVSDLAARIRNEVDIASLQGDILDVVDRSVEPNGVALWLKAGAGR